ncbi:MAG: hypothetical protein LBC19_03675 [Tannerella sp.]|jgi:hypothetical protein|nr:hypothetical protein [Tannerella sp.]
MKLKFRLIATAIATLFTACIFAQTEIRTTAELQAIDNDAASLQGSYVLLNDITIENWNPIGSPEMPFDGQFDGNGHTITIKGFSPDETKKQPLYSYYNLFFGKAKSAKLFGEKIAEIHAGLFCIIGKKGVVKNLKMAGETGYNSGTQTLHIGAVAGVNAGTVQNCISVCQITAEGGKVNLGRNLLTAFRGELTNSTLLFTNGVYAGGLTGVNVGKIENCFSASNIFIDGEGIKCGGGITGGNGSNAGGTIAQCIATGTITTTGSGGVGTKGYYRGAGGIAGQHCVGGLIENCVALNEALTGYYVKCIVGADLAFDAGSTPTGGKVKDSYYQKGITISKSIDAGKDEKATRKAQAGKGMEGKPVEISETHTQTWWETPKDKKSKFAFAFGAGDDAPWTWNDTEKRPALYWERK